MSFSSAPPTRCIERGERERAGIEGEGGMRTERRENEKGGFKTND